MSVKIKDSPGNHIGSKLGVLVIDDQDAGRLATQLALQATDLGARLQVFPARSIDDALDVLAKSRIYVAFLDKDLGTDAANPHHNGISSIPELRALQPHLKVVMVTASNSYEDSKSAILAGAFDYIYKREDPAVFSAKIRKAVEHAVVEFQFGLLSKLQRTAEAEGPSLGGSSAAWMRAVRQTEAFAESDLAILLRGQTGTGKTTLARLAHEHRKQHLKEPVKNFVDINIATISPTIAERELFGSEAGAYTDAKRDSIGYMELARDGTLFLDEIGEATPELQKKLLKVLETGRFYRLGGKIEIHSNFKLICATHCDLEKMVTDGTFREDLYMRISTLQVTVPSLAERREDIPQIIEALTTVIAQKCRRPVSYAQLPPDFIQYLTEVEQPGNIRGIERQLGRLIAGAPLDRNGFPILEGWRTVLDMVERPRAKEKRRNTIELDDVLTLPTNLLVAGFTGHDDILAKISDRLYEEADQKFDGSLMKIAKALGVSRTTAFNHLARIKASKQDKARPPENPRLKKR